MSLFAVRESRTLDFSAGKIVRFLTLSASCLVEQIIVLGADQAFRVVKQPILHDVVGHGLGVSVPVRPANLFVEVQHAFFPCEVKHPGEQPTHLLLRRPSAADVLHQRRISCHGVVVYSSHLLDQGLQISCQLFFVFRFRVHKYPTVSTPYVWKIKKCYIATKEKNEVPLTRAVTGR